MFNIAKLFTSSAVIMTCKNESLFLQDPSVQKPSMLSKGRSLIIAFIFLKTFEKKRFMSNCINMTSNIIVISQNITIYSYCTLNERDFSC